MSHPTGTKQAHTWPQPGSMLTPSLPLLRSSRRSAGRTWGLWSRTGPHRSPSSFLSVRLGLRDLWEDQDVAWIRSHLTEPGAVRVGRVLHWSRLGEAMGNLTGSGLPPSRDPGGSQAHRLSTHGRVGVPLTGDPRPSQLSEGVIGPTHLAQGGTEGPALPPRVQVGTSVQPANSHQWGPPQGHSRGAGCGAPALRAGSDLSTRRTCTVSSRHVRPARLGSRPTPLGQSYSRPATALCTGGARALVPTSAHCSGVWSVPADKPRADLHSPRGAASGKLRWTPIQPRAQPHPPQPLRY